MMLRALGAVVGGYAVIAALTIGLLAAISTLSPASFPAGSKAQPPRPVLLTIIAGGLASSVAGGYVTASLAGAHAWSSAVLGLTALVFTLGTVNLWTSVSAQQPRWYLISLVGVGTLGSWLGGSLRSAAGS